MAPSPIDLDVPSTYEALDRANMLSRLMELDRQTEEAWRLALQFQPTRALTGREAVVVAGMGGSAIAGDLARNLAAAHGRAPIVVLREYDLPAWVNPRSLVILSSYSGNTEETLSVADQALAAGAAVLAITTGGRLAALATQKSFPLLTFHYEAQPRAALGYSLFLLLGALVSLGYLPASAVPVTSACEEVSRKVAELGPDTPTAKNAAKQLAQRLHDKLPLVYGGGLMAEVARRWKGQLNENAKAWAFFEQLPELNHNAVMGYQFPKDLAERLVVIMLSSGLNHPRLALREEVTRRLLQERGVQHHLVQADGRDALSHILSAVVLGDFVSYYLALLNGIDPSSIEAIDFLKAELNRR